MIFVFSYEKSKNHKVSKSVYNIYLLRSKLEMCYELFFVIFFWQLIKVKKINKKYDPDVDLLNLC